MPVYNCEKYILAAIRSVLNQSFTDMELIVVNDGSTDGSSQVIGQVKDPRLSIIDQENMGVAAALNNGIAVARGQFVWRHDADDLAAKDQLAAQMDFLASHSEFDLVGTQIAFMTHRGKRAVCAPHPTDSLFGACSWRELRSEDMSPDHPCPIVHATVLVRRNAFEAVGRYRPLFKVSEDTDLWLRLLERSRVAVLKKCGYFVRLHNQSACRRNQGLLRIYREFAFEFARQRRETGCDDEQRGIFKAPEVAAQNDAAFNLDGALSLYQIAIRAKDWITASQLAISILRATSGRASKQLIFPVLSDRLVQRGVRIKRALGQRFSGKIML